VAAEKLPGGAGGRTGGLLDMFHVFHAGTEWTYNLTALRPANGVHEADRLRASFWNVIRKQSPFYKDTAFLFGIVPLQRLGSGIEEVEATHRLFHFTITKRKITWRQQRAIEFVFYHHPNARVIIHSEFDLGNKARLKVFQDAGYDLRLRHFRLENLLHGASQEVGINEETFQKVIILLQDPTRSFAYSHQSDFIRFSILYEEGGVYLDTDMYVLRPLPKAMNQHLGYQDDPVNGDEPVNGAILVFERRAAFLRRALIRAFTHYNPSFWTTVGPSLLTYLHRQDDSDHTIMPQRTFYPYRHQEVERCFERRDDVTSKHDSYTLHLNSRISSKMETRRGSHCHDLFSRYCLFCDELDDTKPQSFKRLVWRNGGWENLE